MPSCTSTLNYIVVNITLQQLQANMNDKKLLTKKDRSFMVSTAQGNLNEMLLFEG